MRRTFILLPVLVAILVGASPAHAWTWPVDGPVLEPFSFGDDPYAAGQHRGIDVGAPAGAAVRAPSSGTVSFAGTVPGGGRTITIKTGDGYAVTLVHLGTIGVTRGTEVAEGHVVGTIGPSGDVEHPEPYVHLGIRVVSEPEGYVDPLTLLPRRETAPPPAPEPPTSGDEEPGPDEDAPAAEPPAPEPAADRPQKEVPRAGTPKADVQAEPLPVATIDVPTRAEVATSQRVQRGEDAAGVVRTGGREEANPVPAASEAVLVGLKGRLDRGAEAPATVAASVGPERAELSNLSLLATAAFVLSAVGLALCGARRRRRSAVAAPPAPDAVRFLFEPPAARCRVEIEGPRARPRRRGGGYTRGGARHARGGPDFSATVRRFTRSMNGRS